MEGWKRQRSGHDRPSNEQAGTKGQQLSEASGDFGAIRNAAMYVNVGRLCSNMNSSDEYARNHTRFIARFPNHSGFSDRGKRRRDFLFVARFLEIMWGL